MATELVYTKQDHIDPLLCHTLNEKFSVAKFHQCQKQSGREKSYSALQRQVFHKIKDETDQYLRSTENNLEVLLRRSVEQRAETSIIQ